MTVLVVEDEKQIRDVLRRYLEREGFAVLATGSGAQAIELLSGGAVDLAVLDLGLPDVDGTEVLRFARAQTHTPVLVLTARNAVEDRVAGLRMGADDYVTKPFSPTEVVLRVRAVLGRTQGAQRGEESAAGYGGGRLRIDDARHEVVFDGARVELTATEWGLLTALAAVPGRVYSRYELVNRVLGYEFSGYERTIDSHVKNLRHKLGSAGTEVIETVVGVGYRLGLDRDR
ncbi:response regulator transcription factor [Actinocrinis puniceicyclus]|uniref:Response regulator transcription factor n=1 Tax=Actinocrinis puniceicyclus TaxID=977794 RepID=A0A8J8BH12_9ACTN|nr:response regulator transcription factor [Actinocrinis puniceicyclus]